MKLTSILLFILKIKLASATAVGFKCSNSLDSHLDIIQKLLQWLITYKRAEQKSMAIMIDNSLEHDQIK